MSILNWQVNSFSSFASFFIVKTHNTLVSFKLLYFLLWIKRTNKNLGFETSFGWSGENLPNFSCNFRSHKLVFLQILHDSSVSLKMTPVYLFWSNVIYFAQKGQIAMKTLQTWVLESKFTKFLSFWNNKFILHHSSVSWDITPLSFFSWNFIYFQQKEPIKVQIWWNLVSSRKSEIFHFDELLL